MFNKTNGHSASPNAIDLESILVTILDGDDDPELVAAVSEMLVDAMRNAVIDGCAQLQREHGMPKFIKEEVTQQVDLMIDRLKEQFLH